MQAHRGGCRVTAYTGTAGDDKLVGGYYYDSFDISQGGRDTVSAGNGNDLIKVGAALTAADRIDGGTLSDTINLNGDYTKQLAITPKVVVGVENFALEDGHTYNLFLADGDYSLAAGLFTIGGTSEASTARLLIDGSAVTMEGFAFSDGLGDDVLKGGALTDTFVLHGGMDTVVAGAGGDQVTVQSSETGADIAAGDGDDVVILDRGLLANDQIDGGAGADTLVLGELGGATLSGEQISGFETLVLTAGAPQTIVLADNLATADLQGARLTVIVADPNREAADVRIDGSAERDVSLSLVGASGDDILIGGRLGDVLDFSSGHRLDATGAEQAFGRQGADTFVFGAGSFTAAVHVDGGSGQDTLRLDAAPYAPVVFNADTLINVETIRILQGQCDLTLNDGNVAKGQTLLVDASALQFGNLVLDGSAEKDGAFTLLGSAEDDNLTGGAQVDVLVGGLAGDHLVGGGGADKFVYNSIADSAVNGFDNGADTIADLTSRDTIDLQAIDARTDHAGNQAFTLVNAFTGHSGQLVVSFDSSTGVTSVSMDVDGDAQADGLIKLLGDHHGFGNFVL